MPRWGDEPVTFDRSDTLQSALAKLDRSGSGWPYVVLASNCRIADNEVTYHLLARASKRLAAPIAVVAGNPRWRQLARENGLRAYGSVGSLRRARKRSLLSLLEAAVEGLVSLLHVSIARESWVILTVLLLLVGVAGFFVVPVMNVTIRTPVETMNREIGAKVDVSVASMDAGAGIIPGRTLEHRFTVSDFVETTGGKMVGKEKAKGEVTVINTGPGLVVLPQGTFLSTGSGVRFTTTTPLTVGPFGQTGATTAPTSGPAVAGTPGSAASGTPRPAPSGTPGPATSGTPGVSGTILRVPVVAVDLGVKGNVPALAISKVEGDAFRGLTVLNEQPLVGGTDVKARTASAEDRGRLKEALFQKVQSQALSELMLRVRQSESLISHSMQVRIEREEYDKQPDEEADRLGGTVDAVATVIAFANQDLNTLMDRQWKADMPKGYRPPAGNLDISPPEIVEAGARTASLKVKVAGRVERVLEVDDLTQSLRGMSAPEARAKLAGLDNPFRLEKLEIWPAWAPRAYRIEVQTVQ